MLIRLPPLFMGPLPPSTPSTVSSPRRLPPASSLSSHRLAQPAAAAGDLSVLRCELDTGDGVADAPEQLLLPLVAGAPIRVRRRPHRVPMVPAAPPCPHGSCRAAALLPREGADAAEGGRRCSRWTAPMLPKDAGVAPDGRWRCSRRTTSVLPKEPGAAPVGRRQCCRCRAALLPSDGGGAAMGGKVCYHGHMSMLPSADGGATSGRWRSWRLLRRRGGAPMGVGPCSDRRGAVLP